MFLSHSVASFRLRGLTQKNRIASQISFKSPIEINDLDWQFTDVSECALASPGRVGLHAPLLDSSLASLVALDEVSSGAYFKE